MRSRDIACKDIQFFANKICVMVCEANGKKYIEESAFNKITIPIVITLRQPAGKKRTHTPVSIAAIGIKTMVDPKYKSGCFVIGFYVLVEQIAI